MKTSDLIYTKPSYTIWYRTSRIYSSQCQFCPHFRSLQSSHNGIIDDRKIKILRWITLQLYTVKIFVFSNFRSILRFSKNVKFSETWRLLTLSFLLFSKLLMFFLFKIVFTIFYYFWKLSQKDANYFSILFRQNFRSSLILKVIFDIFLTSYVDQQPCTMTNAFNFITVWHKLPCPTNSRLL